jgi:FHS family glucose/mannose:H+ symporter-like MFS transporter
VGTRLECGMSRWRLWWVAYAAFFLDGVGTVLLGPMLPRLERLWGLGDGGGGALLAAQFLGMSLGTIFVLRARRRAMSMGAVSAWVGLSGVGLLVLGGGTPWVQVLACSALLVYGFGLGQVITSLNLRAGAESDGRQSRLSFGNAMWSAGAICGPILMSLALAGKWLGGWLLGLAIVFPLVWLWSLRGDGGREHVRSEGDLRGGTSSAVVLVFAALMFLYGGTESCLSGWVTTFARRVSGAGAVVSPLSTSAFWFGVAGGRAIAAGALKKWHEREALLLLVGGAAVASVGLVFAGSMGQISAWALLAGLMIGPSFAVVVTGVLNQGASSRQTGTVLAMCGLGASVMPLLLGVVSQRVGSLREALMLPGVCLAGMLLVVGGFVRGPEVAMVGSARGR